MTPAQSTLMSYRFDELVEGFVNFDGAHELSVNGVCSDSRAVSPGDLFLSLATDTDACRTHVEQAFARGAVAALVANEVRSALENRFSTLIGVDDVSACAGAVASRFYGQPSRAMTVIGVTGTNGKTSVAHYIAYALGRLSFDGRTTPCGLLGTLGYGLYGRLSSGVLTMPDTLSIHALLAQIEADGARHAVMEVSSHGLAQGRHAGVEFDVGVFTNLSRDHLDYHADMREYGETKRKLFETNGLKAAVVNADDEHGRSIIERMPSGVDIFAYSLNGDPSGLGRDLTPVCGRVVTAHRYSLTLEVSASGVQAEFSAPLLGEFNASNLLAALSSLLACGVSADVAATALRNVPAVAGRMESFGGTEHEPLVVVDYSHTPDSLKTALEALRPQCAGALWCVFGCGGDRDRGKRPEMAEVAQRLADRLLVTDDNPRTESGDDIVTDIVSGFSEGAAYDIKRDRAKAIATAVSAAHPRDTVLIAGKGHEPYQEVKGVRRPFSDAACVRLALRRLHS